jgi:hypothetical protein
MKRREAERVAVAIPLTFERARRHGQPVSAKTVDLSAGGARVRCDRPLRVDEVLRFDLEGVCGQCVVLREHVGQTYAVRFDRFDGEGGARELERLATPVLH